MSDAASRAAPVVFTEQMLADGQRERIKTALDFAKTQVRLLVTRHPDCFPLYTKDGKWGCNQEAWTNWCEGFLCGMLWIFVRRTDDQWWRKKAEHYSRLIKDRQHDRSVHDLGFLFWSSWKRWYELTGDPSVNEVVIQAGKTMGKRFNEEGRYLRSFVAPESCFIDIMMNVGIMFYAAEQTNDKTLWENAHHHCLTTRRYLVRGDGSTVHEGIFDADTGAFLRPSTHQGWRGDSAWARGQSWALYGFGTAYRFTGDKMLLATAQHCADFYMEQTPAHGVPPNDWDEPEPEHCYESSAAAVAAGGFWQLAELTENRQRATRYCEYACEIVETLCTPKFLAINKPGWEGILKHGIYHERKDLGVDESVMWGDYFFVDILDTMLCATVGKH